ncbi:MAG: glycosyltransferase family 2 protein [Candidatus Omnitrophota bacterium]
MGMSFLPEKKTMPSKFINKYGKTSILILSYNTLSFTKLTLLSLMAHSKNEPPFEIIVVDQGSTDGSHKWLSSIRWDNFKYVRLNYNLFFSKGNNLARCLADEDSEYLLLLNSDVCINKDGWLTERIKPMELDPKCGMTGTPGNCHNFERRGGRAFFNDLVSSGFYCTEELFRDKCLIKQGPFKNYIREITGWSMATRKKLWDNLGGLKPEGRSTVSGKDDDNYSHMWSDTEYCCRGQLLGYKVISLPSNDLITHFWGISHKKKSNFAIYKEKENKILDLMNKHEPGIEYFNDE